jgi:DNA-binding transcriptional ArsR family regulator
MWCLVEELREYWRRTLAHYWTRMITTLEGDVLYHARRLALHGHGALFNELHASIDYCGVPQSTTNLWNVHNVNCNSHDCYVMTPEAVAQKSFIRMQPVCQHVHNDVELELSGQGIQLVPVVFRGCGRMYQFADSWQPMIAYGARGGGLWYQKATSPTQSLELAMGAGRATVLRTLLTPASNGEVAYKAKISAATANQHLMRLVKAGLVRSNRSGKRVYYSLTERGANLLALFDIVD